MSTDERSFSKVLASLSSMRSSLNAEEQQILDRIVLRTNLDDEVSAHSMATSVSMGSTLSVTLNVTTGEYERITL